MAEPEDEVCGNVVSMCRCTKEPGHVEAGDDVHECDPDVCTGAWKGDFVAGEGFVIVRLPFPVP